MGEGAGSFMLSLSERGNGHCWVEGVEMHLNILISVGIEGRRVKQGGESNGRFILS